MIGNEFSEDRAGIVDAKQKRTGWWAQRLTWFLRDGDVLVCATAPEPEYLRYVCDLIDTRVSSLRLVVPPPGALGEGVLSDDRLANPSFVAELRETIGDDTLEAIIPLHPQAGVARLARALGAETALPGAAFMDQGGGRLANSKAAFRAVAAGNGVPTASGAVCTTRAEALEAITGFVERGLPVIAKHDLRAGGRGNEVLTPVDGFEPVGAERRELLHDREQVAQYLGRRWAWLTSEGRSPLTIEQYHPGSRALYAEFEITRDGARFAGQGELISAPLAAAEIVPAPDLSKAELESLLLGGERLACALYHLGYRGVVSADAILTPERELLFTEYNSRITGTTPVYEIIGKRIIGPDYADNRVLLDHDGWYVPSFRAALDTLAVHGLAYDPELKTGVILVLPLNPVEKSVRYCIAELDLDRAWAVQARVGALLGGLTR